MSFDHSVFFAINHSSEDWAPLMRFMSQGLNYWPTKLLLLCLVGWLIWRGSSHRQAAIVALVGFLVSDGTCSLFKRFLPELRPFKDPLISNVTLRIGKFSDMPGYGTASSHSANMAAVAIAFWMFLGWRWGLPWAIVALLTGISRIYNGVHYPHQVLLGWIIGIGLTGLVSLIVKKRSKSSPESLPESS